MKFKIIYLLPIIIIIIGIEIYANIKRPSWHEPDNILGWRLKKNFSHTYSQVDAAGQKYKATINTDEKGFRRFLEVNNKKKIKVLVIGDSFVADPYVDDKKMWFSVMAQDLNIKMRNFNFDVYAGGGGGYGTIQEYLLLEEVLKDLKPDIFILNFCSNDFNNNSYEIEKEWSGFNQTWRRPYADKNDNIFYEIKFLAKVSRAPIIGDSKIFNKIIYLLSSIKKVDKNNLYDQKKMDDAIQITDRYLKKISQILKNTKIFICNCSNEINYMNKKWIELGLKNSFIPLINANNEINKSIKKKENIYYYDLGHFNEKGNKIYGKSIAKEIYPHLLDYLTTKMKTEK
jgi:lysophospholipase L1-like esterase